MGSLRFRGRSHGVWRTLECGFNEPRSPTDFDACDLQVKANLVLSLAERK